jgi:NAD(P)-dependent dehydrogenase (short-subunit alcohol dehydrogenase family)
MTRVAVVTGGAGAIGTSIVSALGQAGHTTLTLDQAGDPPVDLSDEHQVRAAAARVLRQNGRCDVLVHAAAAFDRADLTAVDLVTWRRVQAVESALLLAQAWGHGADGIAVTCVAPGLTATPAARQGLPAAVFR